MKGRLFSRREEDMKSSVKSGRRRTSRVGGHLGPLREQTHGDRQRMRADGGVGRMRGSGQNGPLF